MKTIPTIMCVSLFALMLQACTTAPKTRLENIQQCDNAGAVMVKSPIYRGETNGPPSICQVGGCDNAAKAQRTETVMKVLTQVVVPLATAIITYH